MPNQVMATRTAAMVVRGRDAAEQGGTAVPSSHVLAITESPIIMARMEFTSQQPSELT